MQTKCAVQVASQLKENGSSGWMSYQPLASPCPDFDADGIPDTTEDQLLATFRRVADVVEQLRESRSRGQA